MSGNSLGALSRASFTFSANGRSLIIWQKDGTYLAQFHDLRDNPLGRKFLLERISLAAAGNERIIVMRKDAMVGNTLPNLRTKRAC